MTTEVNRVFILPGEYFISKQPHIISTLLGSCVAVCLYNTKLRFGGMNHFMLPTSPNKERSGKYGDYAIAFLIQFMQRTAGSLEGVEAIISGGANVVTNITSGTQIGQRNIETARQVLARHNIRIIKENVGGSVGLKLHYQNWDNKLTIEEMDRRVMGGSTIQKEEIGRFGAPAAFSAPKPAAASSAAPVSRSTGSPIKVLVVDDSAIVRNLLTKAMADEPDIKVVGAAKDAYEAREMLLELGPDVITLDIIMPKMDGVTFLKKLMVYFPIPVIICSTIAKSGSQAELRSDQIGAVDVIDKETLNLYQGLDTVKKILIPKIRAAAKTKVTKKLKEEVAGL
ncbi:MAG: response regulator [Deltaproteobacteria bacterium]|jgi:two-component system chemotaxis response regulator CheB|nr:response regulator [Deltaproteobacteria bacterium]